MAYDALVSEGRILGRVNVIERTGQDLTDKLIDLQSGKWRMINHLLAVVHRLRSALYFKIYSPLNLTAKALWLTNG